MPEALRYLADHERPSAGQQRFNAEHLYQLADEIERMAKTTLYAAPPAQPSAEEVREAIELLKAAACPACDGSGSWGRQVSPTEIEQVQCQWCYERHALLAKLKGN